MKERAVIRRDRVRKIPQSFSWIDRDILHRGYLEKLSREEIIVYFFLVLVAGPEGTSFWSYRRIAKLLKLSEHEVISATAGLIRKDLIEFLFPTYQVLSLPPSSQAQKEEGP